MLSSSDDSVDTRLPVRRWRSRHYTDTATLRIITVGVARSGGVGVRPVTVRVAVCGVSQQTQCSAGQCNPGRREGPLMARCVICNFTAVRPVLAVQRTEPVAPGG